MFILYKHGNYTDFHLKKSWRREDDRAVVTFAIADDGLCEEEKLLRKTSFHKEFCSFESSTAEITTPQKY